MKKAEGKKKCIGITSKGKQCIKNISDDTTCCDNHDHFEDFTKEQMNDIKLGGNGNMTVCIKCTKWRANDDFLNESNKIVKKCQVCRDMDKDYIVNKKPKPKKCEWRQGNGKKCNKNKINNTDYCISHDYVCKYTEKMKKESILCTNCKRYQYMAGKGQYKE